MNKRTRLCFLMLALLLTACSNVDPNQAIPAVTPSQELSIPEDLRDFRYCEILPVFRNQLTFTIEVYNTIGSSDCPAELWNQIDPNTLAETYNAFTVEMNGPRYWVINAAVGSDSTAAGKIVNLGGLEMKLVALIEFKMWEAPMGESYYEESVVQRSNSWIFFAGNMVYELTNPQGEVYRMQSYSQQIDPALSIDDLEMLGDRLDLPDGWHYDVRVLEADSTLVADGMAYMIADEFRNAYMKITP